MGDGVDRRVEAAAKALAERATGPGVMQDGWRIIGFTPWQIAEVMLATADAVDDRRTWTIFVCPICSTQVEPRDEDSAWCPECSERVNSDAVDVVESRSFGAVSQGEEDRPSVVTRFTPKPGELGRQVDKAVASLFGSSSQPPEPEDRICEHCDRGLVTSMDGSYTYGCAFCGGTGVRPSVSDDRSSQP